MKLNRLFLLTFLHLTFQTYAQDSLSVEDVVSISIIANENDANIHGYYYLVEKNKNEEFEIYQERSYFLPVSNGNDFELFHQLDQKYKLDRKGFIGQLSNDEFDSQIDEFNVDQKIVKSFYASRIGSNSNIFNSDEKKTLGVIDKNDIESLLYQINNSRSTSTLDGLMKDLEINENFVVNCDKDTFLKKVKNKCHETCLEKVSENNSLKVSTSMLVESKMIESGLGAYKVTFEIQLKNGEKFLIENKGNKEFLVPVNINGDYDTYNPNLSIVLGRIIPNNSNEIKSRLTGENFKNKVLENAIRIYCSDCK